MENDIGLMASIMGYHMQRAWCLRDILWLAYHLEVSGETSMHLGGQECIVHMYHKSDFGLTPYIVMRF